MENKIVHIQIDNWDDMGEANQYLDEFLYNPEIWNIFGMYKFIDNLYYYIFLDVILW